MKYEELFRELKIKILKHTTKEEEIIRNTSEKFKKYSLHSGVTKSM